MKTKHLNLVMSLEEANHVLDELSSSIHPLALDVCHNIRFIRDFKKPRKVRKDKGIGRFNG